MQMRVILLNWDGRKCVFPELMIGLKCIQRFFFKLFVPCYIMEWCYGKGSIQRFIVAYMDGVRPLLKALDARAAYVVLQTVLFQP